VTRDFTTLRGRIDQPALSIRIDGAEAATPIARLRSLKLVHEAPITPGEITDGSGVNSMTYYLRVPREFPAALDAPAEENGGWPAIVLLHGSNMNSKAYVATFAAQWPALADRYILIGLNGERHVAGSPPENPAFNYTYVNFAGRSRYEGYPGTDRESPALVAEMIREFRTRLPIERIIVLGHSQGAFLTYSIMMNYPELIDGAIPISGGLIVQCEPEAYEDDELIAAQRRVPLAIVHGTTDNVVSFDMSAYAHGQFEKAGFSKLKLFAHQTAGHRFAFLPIDEAVKWIESIDEPD
jgi:predicted esterase